MSRALAQRSNAEWLEALQGQGDDHAVALDELQSYLRRALARMLSARGLRDEDLKDIVQETMARLLASHASFRGDSAFTTWATAVATRVGFTELRRRGGRERGTEAFEEVCEEALVPNSLDGPSMDEALGRKQLFSALGRAIERDLTDRQKKVVLAELRGLSTIEIAERMDTTQNALYKVAHDARKKLRAALIAAGFSPDVILEYLSGGTAG